MSMDAMNALRSLFAPSLRNLDTSQGADPEKAFLQALGLDTKPDTKAPIIDGLPVESKIEESPEFSDVPETPDGVDPQILLTQKLAASMMGFHGWEISEPPVVPQPQIPTPEPPVA
jgi:hypothetical protein